jgi:hypothetical protein
VGSEGKTRKQSGSIGSTGKLASLRENPLSLQGKKIKKSLQRKNSFNWVTTNCFLFPQREKFDAINKIENTFSADGHMTR